MGDPNVVLQPTIQTGSLNIADAAPATGKFNLSDASLVPGQDKLTLDNSQRVGTFDKLPVLNVQNVGFNDRLLTQLLFDTPEEKVKYLESYLGDGYEYAVHPKRPTDIILKKKGDKHWGVIDPGGRSMDELIPEFMENLDGIAQMVSIPAGVLTGAATTGGIQGLRQVLRKAVMPDSEAQLGKVAVDTISGGVGGGLSGALVSGTKKATQYGVSKTGQILETVGEKVSQSADGGILSKVGQKLDFVNAPDFIAKEIGGSAKQLNPLKKGLLVNKIDYLQKNFPEFVEAYKGAFTLKGKFQNVAKVFDDAGEAVVQNMQQMADVEVPVKNILQSAAFGDLQKAATTRFVKEGKKTVRVNRANKIKINNVRKDFLEDVASMVLGEGESSNSILSLYRNNKLINTDLAKELGAKTNDEALIAIIGDKTIPLGDAWALRMGRDQIINYGKQAGQISAKNTTDKYTADAVRQAMQDTLSGTPGGEELLRSMDLFSNLHPVVTTMGSTLGTKATGSWNPLSTLPGMINSAPRFAAKLGINLANKMEVRAFVEGLSKSKFPLPADGIQVGGSGSALLGQVSRGLKFNFAKGYLNKNAEAQTLPRNVDAYFENPDYINQLEAASDDPELTDSMVRMFERGDKNGFANVLSMVTSGNEAAFDTAPYKSLVMNNGKPVIMDMHEREQYRQYLSKTIVDPRDRYMALQALNSNNEMVAEPFQPPKNYLEVKGSVTPRQTSIERAANQLKKADIVKLDDGTERRDYDY